MLSRGRYRAAAVVYGHLHIPRETWEAVNKLAREHQRSFTKELVWALQEYVRRERKRERER